MPTRRSVGSRGAPGAVQKALREEDEELNSMVTSFTSPISDKIFMAFDTKKTHKENNESKQESPLGNEEREMESAVFREFTIYIFQSISFLQTLVIDE
jgi:hypothetical protein